VKRAIFELSNKTVQILKSWENEKRMKDNYFDEVIESDKRFRVR
jgi:hypothetical protein